jgi:WD40 repeat protein
VTFFNDGRRLISASEDGEVRVWDIGAGQVLLPPLQTSLSVNAVAVSNDGALFAAACGSTGRGGQLKIWRTADGQEANAPRTQTEPLRWVAFTPDNKRLATVGDDGILVLWDARTGRDALSIDDSRWPLSCGCFSADGTILSTANVHGTIRVYRTKN